MTNALDKNVNNSPSTGFFAMNQLVSYRAITRLPLLVPVVLIDIPISDVQVSGYLSPSTLGSITLFGSPDAGGHAFST